MKTVTQFVQGFLSRCTKKSTDTGNTAWVHMLMAVVIALTMTLSWIVPMTAYADNGKVTYDGNAKDFIFEPGSEYSPTDLFLNFKDVMPGDSITQKITVRNDASNKVKVKIYMRSLGAHEDSKDFLSQLHLRVEKSANNEHPYMFDAAADKTAQLTDWVLLGTLYSGGEVNLDVILDVPVELDNAYSNQIGYLDWEFMIEEFPIEPTDPEIPNTGDDIGFILWIILEVIVVIFIIILIILRRKSQKDDKEENGNGQTSEENKI